MRHRVTTKQVFCSWCHGNTQQPPPPFLFEWVGGQGSFSYSRSQYFSPTSHSQPCGCWLDSAVPLGLDMPCEQVWQTSIQAMEIALSPDARPLAGIPCCYKLAAGREAFWILCVSSLRHLCPKYSSGQKAGLHTKLLPSSCGWLFSQVGTEEKINSSLHLKANLLNLHQNNMGTENTAILQNLQFSKCCNVVRQPTNVYKNTCIRGKYA